MWKTGAVLTTTNAEFHVKCDIPQFLRLMTTRIFFWLFYFFKVVVGPKRSTNRYLKQIIAIECTKTVIFQLLRSLDISKLAKRELIQ